MTRWRDVFCGIYVVVLSELLFATVLLLVYNISFPSWFVVCGGADFSKVSAIIKLKFVLHF